MVVGYRRDRIFPKAAENHHHSMEVCVQIQQIPVAKAEMLIRKPVAEVFEAFVNPAITSKFWFTKEAGGYKRANRSAGIGKCIVTPCR